MRSKYTPRIPKSAWLAAAICLLVGIVLVVRGESVGEVGFSMSGSSGAICEEYEHGWPWVYVNRSAPRESGSRWRVWQNVERIDPLLLAGDVVCILMIGGVCVALLLAVRSRRPPMQFSIREILAMGVILASVLGWWSYYHGGHGEEAALIRNLEARGHACESEYVGPLWLRRLVDKDRLVTFHRVRSINFAPDLTEAELAALLPDLQRLKHLRSVFVSRSPTGDQMLMMLSCLEHVEELGLSEAEVTAAGLAALGSLRRVTFLQLYHVRVSDECVPILASFEELEYLDIRGTAISPEAKRDIESNAFGMPWGHTRGRTKGRGMVELWV